MRTSLSLFLLLSAVGLQNSSSGSPSDFRRISTEPVHREVSARRNAASVSPSAREIEIKLFFINQSLPAFKDDCSAGEFVPRLVPSTKQIAQAALKQLFAGPTAAEKAKGMLDTGPLGDYYLGVKIKNGTAIVNFRRGAEKYLYVTGPICQQEMVLAPITKTLKQFATILSVDYAIEGTIIEDWDA